MWFFLYVSFDISVVRLHACVCGGSPTGVVFLFGRLIFYQFLELICKTVSYMFAGYPYIFLRVVIISNRLLISLHSA